MGDGGWGGVGLQRNILKIDLTVLEVFECLESSACLYYCFSLLCQTSIKVSSIFSFATIAPYTHQGEHYNVLFTSPIEPYFQL